MRVLATMLVILHHTAIGYGGSGGWFWRQEPNASNLALVMFNAVNQSFFMGLFFLLAGYYTPPSHDRKRPLRFLMERLIRLGLPLLAFFFILYPLTIAIARTGDGRPLMGEWWALTKAHDFGSGPLWFALALLIFTAGYTGWRQTRPSMGAAAPPALPGPALLATGGVAVGLISFFVRLVMPVGAEVLWMQLGYFPAYIVLFIAGCAAARGRVLDTVTGRDAGPWMIVSLIALVTLPIMMLMRGGTGRFEGGWNLNALYYALWDPFVSLGIILGLFWAARTWWGRAGPVSAWLARGAFGAFIVHPPVVVALSVWTAGWAAAASIKFVVVGMLACAGSFVLSAVLRVVPGVRGII